MPVGAPPPPVGDDDAPLALPAADARLAALPDAVRDGPCSEDPTTAPAPEPEARARDSECDDSDDDNWVRYLVGGKKGAILRQGSALDSEKIGELPFLTALECRREERVVAGKRRVRVLRAGGDDCRGWVSRKLLEPYETHAF